MADQPLALMKRGEATMYVPLQKVAAYLLDGWKELTRPADAQAAEEKVAVDTEVRPTEQVRSSEPAADTQVRPKAARPSKKA